MKRILVITALAALLAVVCSCGNGARDFKPSSVGPSYEVLVITAQDKWEGQLGDTLRSIMGQPVEFLNSYEPRFDLMRIMPNNFTDLLRKSRNILNVVTGSDYPEAGWQADYNVYAAPQLIVTLSGPDQESLTEFVSENREYLVAIYENAERDWSLEVNKRYNESGIEQKIYEMFGVRMNIPKGYMIRNTLEDFMWLSFEYPTASQGMIIYSYPYSGREFLSEEWLIYNRNQFVSKIPGENPGSHMTTYDGFTPDVRYIRREGRDWAVMRGFWEVEGDYMGGPFVSYSTVDAANGTVVTFDLYVFSPDKPKRNFLRQLENIIYSVEFPEDADR